MSVIGPISAVDPDLRSWLAASEIFEIDEFMRRVFPPAWSGIRARVLETGATLSPTPCAWAPRWTPIPPTTDDAPSR